MEKPKHNVTKYYYFDFLSQLDTKLQSSLCPSQVWLVWPSWSTSSVSSNWPPRTSSLWHTVACEVPSPSPLASCWTRGTSPWEGCSLPLSSPLSSSPSLFRYPVYLVLVQNTLKLNLKWSDFLFHYSALSGFGKCNFSFNFEVHREAGKPICSLNAKHVQKEYKKYDLCRDTFLLSGPQDNIQKQYTASALCC